MSLIAALLATELAAAVLPPRDGPTRIVMQQRELPEGGVIGWHSHPGAEMTYVLAGEVQISTASAGPKTSRAGEAFIVQPGEPHAGRCLSAGGCTVITTHYLEAGLPAASPVPAPEPQPAQPERIP